MTADASSEVSFAVRPVRAEDEAFLFSSFLGWYRNSDHVNGIMNTEFYEIFKAQLASVLAHFTVIVAHPEGQEDEIAGWLAYKWTTVACLHVKHHPWGRLGAARLLLATAGITKKSPVWLLYGESRSIRRAKEKGWNVRLVPATQAIRLLLGIG